MTDLTRVGRLAFPTCWPEPVVGGALGWAYYPGIRGTDRTLVGQPKLLVRVPCRPDRAGDLLVAASEARPIEDASPWWGFLPLLIILAVRYPLNERNEQYLETATLPLAVASSLLALRRLALITGRHAGGASFCSSCFRCRQASTNGWPRRSDGCDRWQRDVAPNARDAGPFRRKRHHDRRQPVGSGASLQRIVDVPLVRGSDHGDDDPGRSSRSSSA